MAVSASQIQQLYIAYYGRPADPAGLAYWQAQAAAGTARGTTDAAILDSFGASFGANAEYTATFANMSDVQKVNTVYNNLFSHDADPVGLLYWATKLTNGDLTIANIVRAVSTSAVTAANVDGTAFNSKVTAAESFTGALTSTAQILGYTGTAAGVAAKAWITGINSAATLATAIAAPALAATVATVAAPAVVAGQTFTLTTNVDQGTAFAGTTGNDTFSGLVDYTAGGVAVSAATTLNVSDVFGGGGQSTADVLNITVTGSPNAAVTLPAATITGFETINVRGALTVAQIVTMAASGATNLNADRSTDAVVFTGLASGAVIGSITGSAAVSGTYAAGVTAGTFNAQSGVTAGVVTVTANADNLMTTLNINSTGAANVLTSANVATGTGVKAVNINATTNLTTGNITGLAAGTAITVTGAATAVNLGALQSTVTTVTATGLAAGGITATIGAVAQVLTLGAGTNVITTGGVQTGAVTAGSGTSDRLIAASAADVAATPAAKFTGFEILQNDAAANLDVSLVSGITSVHANNAAAGFTNMTATQAGAVVLRATNTSGTFGLANATGTADVLSITLENLLAANAATVVSHTGALVAGFETMNVAVNSGISTAVTAAGATGADQIAFTTATNLKTLNVTGAYSVGISVTGTTAVAVTSINASGLTGSTAGAGITLGGNTGALTVTGSNNNDFVLLGTLGTGGTVTVNTGSGNDTIAGTQAQVAAATINGGTNTTAGDTLALSDTTTTIADNTFVNVSGIEKITLANTTALTWTVGGYANALATANSGVLDIAAAALAPTSPAAIDASGLGGTNSLKLTMTSTAGGSAVNITGSPNGADNISVTTATSGGAFTISAAGAVGSTAAKTVTFAGAVGTGAITTGAGADSITVGATVTTVTAGAGADTITLGAADGVQQTLTVSAANASPTTGYDRVTNFSTVVTNGDVLDVATTVILTTAQLITGVAGWAVSSGGTTVGVATKTGATLADFISAFSASTTAGVVVFADGGHTYLGHSDGSGSTTTSDQLVMLVGVTGVTGITASATTVSTNVSVI